jgi:hypothetical protein
MRPGRGLIMIDLTDCPQCGAPAEVRWRAVLSSTVGRAGVLCSRQHFIIVPAASLPVAPIAIPIPLPSQRTGSPELPAVTRRSRWGRTQA